MTYSFKVNERQVHVDGPGLRPLLDAVRDDLGLMGTKPGCGEGRCGACTVLVEGQPVVSCLYPVALADGKALQTVEGLSDGERLSPLQDSLLEHGAVQCGACTPGMIVSLTAVLARDPAPTEHTVREALAGNICRCTGYTQLVQAALAAAEQGGAA